MGRQRYRRRRRRLKKRIRRSGHRPSWWQVRRAAGAVARSLRAGAAPRATPGAACTRGETALASGRSRLVGPCAAALVCLANKIQRLRQQVSGRPCSRAAKWATCLRIETTFSSAEMTRCGGLRCNARAGDTQQNNNSLRWGRESKPDVAREGQCAGNECG